MEFQQGMNVTFVTTANSDSEGRKLLSLFGMPFRRPTAGDQQPLPSAVKEKASD